MSRKPFKVDESHYFSTEDIDLEFQTLFPGLKGSAHDRTTKEGRIELFNSEYIKLVEGGASKKDAAATAAYNAGLSQAEAAEQFETISEKTRRRFLGWI